MRATITAVKKQVSKHNGHTIMAVFFKGEDGKAYKMWLDITYGNYNRWRNVLRKGTILDSLRVKSGTLIDADSMIQLIQMGE